jgi:hypothetical protein
MNATVAVIVKEVRYIVSTSFLEIVGTIKDIDF